jgi:phosphoribosylformimino-5-aminoimidazole carboxamide ribonucleotide (ProFAR) isomerase
MKVIAAVDIMDGRVVRLVRGNPDDKIEYLKQSGSLCRSQAALDH